MQLRADRGEPLKKQRFVKVTGRTVVLDEASIERARQAAGYQGHATNIAPATMDGHAVVAAYHDLWKVEQSFRMAKSDLKARPGRHRLQQSTNPPSGSTTGPTPAAHRDNPTTLDSLPTPLNSEAPQAKNSATELTSRKTAAESLISRSEEIPD